MKNMFCVYTDLTQEFNVSSKGVCDNGINKCFEIWSVLHRRLRNRIKVWVVKDGLRKVMDALLG